MLFNSLEFALFLPLIFILYWFCTQHSLRVQNLLLLSASYVFYGWWDYRFLLLIIISSAIDYYCGLAIHSHSEKAKRKIYLYLSLVVNLGLLGFFKYYNFFVDSFVMAFSNIGIALELDTLQILLPVGISFYTFQTLSYTIDIYRKEYVPTRDMVTFFAFVSFFPQLIAGPIERAKDLLPQLLRKRHFSYDQVTDGLRQVTWGLFQKVIIADKAARIIDRLFSNPNDFDGLSLILGAFLVLIQFYGDFAGYSNIAIGSAKLLGIKLSVNFRYPLFSRNIREFWSRWHITLMSWLRDYLYIPLGGSRDGNLRKALNIVAVFGIAGLWHGASGNYMLWGILNGLLFVVSMAFVRKKKTSNAMTENSFLHGFQVFYQTLFTMTGIALLLIFFRSEDLNLAFKYFAGILDIHNYAKFLLRPQDIVILLLIVIFIVFEWFQRHNDHGFDVSNWNKWLRWLTYVIIYLFIFKYGDFSEKAFEYFMF